MRRSGLWCPVYPLLEHSSEDDIVARDGGHWLLRCKVLMWSVMEGKTRESAEEVRTRKAEYVRVDYSSAEHGSVAVVGRSASGRQDRSGARRHGRHDRGELLDLHVASEGEWCE